MAKRQKRKKTKSPSASKITKFANSSIPETLDALNVPTFGLTEKYVADKTKKVGKKEKFPWFKYFIDSFKDAFTLILCAIVVYNLVMFSIDPEEYTYIAGAGLIICSLAISIIVTEFTNYGIWKGNQKQSSVVENVNVLRNVVLNENGNPFASPDQEKQLETHLTTINIKNMLVGDIIYVKAGDVIPADARVLYGDDFYVDQELLTGSNVPVNKKYFNSSFSKDIFKLSNIIYRGTKVTRGGCWALVLTSPDKSVYAEQVAKISNQENKSTFTTQIKKITRTIIYTVIIAVPTIFILVALLKGSKAGFGNASVWVDSILFAMSLAIALSPDGLPMMLSAAFSRTRGQLAKKNIQIRDLSSVQNIGSMNVLAVDIAKTFLNDDYRIQSYSDLYGYSNPLIIDYLLLSFAESPSADLNLNKTVLEAAEYKARLQELKKRYVFINRITVDSGVYLHFLDKQLNKELIIKRDKIDTSLGLATMAMNAEGQLNKITPTQKVNYLYKDERQGAILSYGIDFKYLEKEYENFNNQELFFKNYDFLGRVDFQNSVKPGSSSIIKEIQKEEINVVLFSRKSLGELIALSRELDFKLEEAINGQEISKLSDAQLYKKMKTSNAFYNMNLADELRVLKLYKKKENTVGYLGSDIEDTFQLLTEDIGITTDSSDNFAQSAATLVVNHLDLMQIVTSIRASRVGLMNTMKYIKLKNTGAISLVAKLLFGIILLNHESMTAIQLLAQNMVYNVVEYTIIYDDVNEQYLLKPVKWDTKSLLPFAFSNTAIILFIHIIVMIIMIFAFDTTMLSDIRNEKGNWEAQLQQLQSTAFIEDSISHLVFIFVARDNFVRFWKSRPTKPLLIALILAAVFFIALPTIPKVQSAFSMRTPQWEFFVILPIAMLGLMSLVDLNKEIYFRRQKQWF
ncbi:cation transporting ATPase C-terminal domain-containing protein [Mesoplasma lactucae]|uniref:Cation-transporting P-type ATPase N-terminal domain-containing protein n=2 Tax=Mesoplasma lactucae TaxID=138853 RepID=A0A291IRQ6_9MOLU|nr:cation transporting ATPase C-terminal domain-containing protein [Mesoplasma lactucae]ATG97396.1 hypothetical protein CP520_01315 [Mesoplasma lactucae ATCC 49193]